MPQVPNRLIGDTGVHAQFGIQLVYMLSGLIEFTSFSLFLVYQVNSCEALGTEFARFLNRSITRRERRNMEASTVQPELLQRDL